MIFCRTNLDCSNLEEFLCSQDGGPIKKFRGKVESGKEGRYSCCVVAGLRSNKERSESMAAFKDGNVRFLICTDVAARGIDVTNLPYVINMTLPDEAENYIHRIGRVGRADKMGLAISIVASDGYEEKVWFHTCKGKGRDGEVCDRRQLVSKGGCTIWYNEAEKFNAIQQRLDMVIPHLKEDYSLPDELAALNIVYGESTKDNSNETSSNSHLDLLAPSVKELASMEFESQNIFLNICSSFSKGK
jgi:ATP-dependent RNA helicase DDX1